MPLTIPVANTWLYGRLSGDATLTGLVAGRIYDRRVPQGGTLPAVVFQHQGGSTLLGGGATRIWSDLVYVVKVIGQGGSLSALRPIADRVDTLLHAASGSVAGGSVIACVLEAELVYDEDRDGVIYTHLGARYRLYATVT